MHIIRRTMVVCLKENLEAKGCIRGHIPCGQREYKESFYPLRYGSMSELFSVLAKPQ